MRGTDSPSVVARRSKGKSLERRLDNAAYSARLEATQDRFFGAHVTDTLRAMECADLLGSASGCSVSDIGYQFQVRSLLVSCSDDMPVRFISCSNVPRNGDFVHLFDDRYLRR